MPLIKKQRGRLFAGCQMLFLMILGMLILIMTGCSGAQRLHASMPKPPASAEAARQPGQPPRFEVVYEHGETKNLGGFSVIRDNATGQEYLAVIGLNGSSSVIMLKTPAPVSPGSVR